MSNSGWCALSYREQKDRSPADNIAVLVSAEQTLAPSFFAVVDLHDMRCLLLVLVVIGHVHIVVNKLDARKYPIECGIPCATFVLQRKATVTGSRQTIFLSGDTVQINACKAARYGTFSPESRIFC